MSSLDKSQIIDALEGDDRSGNISHSNLNSDNNGSESFIKSPNKRKGNRNGYNNDNNNTANETIWEYLMEYRLIKKASYLLPNPCSYLFCLCILLEVHELLKR